MFLLGLISYIPLHTLQIHGGRESQDIPRVGYREERVSCDDIAGFGATPHVNPNDNLLSHQILDQRLGPISTVLFLAVEPVEPNQVLGAITSGSGF
jgi:hypothetical protein